MVRFIQYLLIAISLLSTIQARQIILSKIHQAKGRCVQAKKKSELYDNTQFKFGFCPKRNRANEVVERVACTEEYECGDRPPKQKYGACIIDLRSTLPNRVAYCSNTHDAYDWLSQQMLEDTKNKYPTTTAGRCTATNPKKGQFKIGDPKAGYQGDNSGVCSIDQRRHPNLPKTVKCDLEHPCEGKQVPCIVIKWGDDDVAYCATSEDLKLKITDPSSRQRLKPVHDKLTEQILADHAENSVKRIPPARQAVTALDVGSTETTGTSVGKPVVAASDNEPDGYESSDESSDSDEVEVNQGTPSVKSPAGKQPVAALNVGSGASSSSGESSDSSGKKGTTTGKQSISSDGDVAMDSHTSGSSDVEMADGSDSSGFGDFMDDMPSSDNERPLTWDG